MSRSVSHAVGLLTGASMESFEGLERVCARGRPPAMDGQWNGHG